jgi:hypothetical protein
MNWHDSSEEALAARLAEERPVPAASFRGKLHRRFAGVRVTSRPRHLWALAAAGLGSGGVLLALALAGALGTGPFGH